MMVVVEGEGNAPGRRLLLAGTGGAILLLMPLLLHPYSLLILGYALVFSIACLGLNLLFGNTGLVSLGHAAYFGVGAYTGGFLYAFSPVSSLEIYLISGVLASTALSAVFGFICVRATRIHFTILTLALAQMVHSLFISGIIFRPFGGVGKGLFLIGGGGLYIPRFTVLGTELAPHVFDTAFYYVILAAFCVCVFLMWRIVNSPFGKALRAIRDNDIRAELIGIRVQQYRWYAFIVSGTVLGLAGGLFGQWSRQVTPQQLHWLFSAELVLATVLGGTRLFLGPVAGAFAFVALQEIALRFTVYRSLVLGVMFITAVLVLPGGLAGGVAALSHAMRRRLPRPGDKEA
jgi:branched-chain amino acid transport system permease protein